MLLKKYPLITLMGLMFLVGCGFFARGTYRDHHRLEVKMPQLVVTEQKLPARPVMAVPVKTSSVQMPAKVSLPAKNSPLGQDQLRRMVAAGLDPIGPVSKVSGPSKSVQ